MTVLFECPYCDYRGSDAWAHLMKNHITIRDQWDPNRAPKQKVQAPT